MSEAIKLSHISNGTSCKVKSIHADTLRVKFMEMGIVPGRQLEVLFRAPLGDPIAVDIDGYILSLRKDEAAMIEVELETQHQ